MQAKSLDLSLVIPVFNEAENIVPLSEKISQALKKKRYEVLWIDDGSTDATSEKIKKLSQKDKKHKLIQLRRNFGQTAALMAGFDLATGSVIVTLDGDGQNDPFDIPVLVEKLNQGYDLVSGWRRDRQDEESRVLVSQLANQFIAQLTKLPLHDFGCTLKVYRADLVKELQLYGEMHRFIPAIASYVGARVTEVAVRHHPRQAGMSKYGWGRLVRVLLDLLMVSYLLAYQTRPLQFFGQLGLGILTLGGGGFTWLVYLRLFKDQPLSNRPLFSVTIMLILVGVQMITLGVLAEIMARVYFESTGKKTYYIRK